MLYSRDLWLAIIIDITSTAQLDLKMRAKIFIIQAHPSIILTESCHPGGRITFIWVSDKVDESIVCKLSVIVERLEYI